jgi:MFS family permease
MTHRHSVTSQSAAWGQFASLLPIMAVVFAAYFVIGSAMPVLPLHVHQRLGFSTFIVGLTVSGQFATAIFTRFWAGHHVDTYGPRHAMLNGLYLAAASGFFYLFSVAFLSRPTLSVLVLLLGRVLLGIAESFIMTGAFNLGIAMLGAENTGKVMAWVGTSLYAAMAVGAPIGMVLYGRYGFIAIAAASILIPLVTIPAMRMLHPVPLSIHPPQSSAHVARTVLMPGISLALSCVGYGAIATFLVLLYAQQGWEPKWLPFTVLSASFMIGRMALGHLPDRMGGARVAFYCIALEAVGQALIWLAHTPLLSIAGVALTGLSFSLVYPALAAEVIRRVAPQSRGLALGSYSAFYDLSLCINNPLLGFIATRYGLSSVYLASSLFAAAAVLFTMRLSRVQNHQDMGVSG